jgi:hypothetical protein
MLEMRRKQAEYTFIDSLVGDTYAVAVADLRLPIT